MLLNIFPPENWFVLQVKTSREFFIKNYIEKHSNEQIPMVIFSRELIFKRNGMHKKVLDLLFPGYIFVHKKIRKALEIIKKNIDSEFIRPICFKTKKCNICFIEKSPCMVRKHEMRLLLKNSDYNGIFRLSQGYQIGDKIIIENGPLKNLTGNILWINERKKKAGIEIKLLGMSMKINLGINIKKEHATLMY